jgi:predicted alpha-1,6-mannanase (GH76 family)
MKRHIIFSLFISILLVNSLQAENTVPDGVYKISNCFAGNKVLSIGNSSIDNSAEIIPWVDTNVNAQRWRVTTNETNGYHYLTNMYSGKAMHVKMNPPSTGTKIDQQTGNTSEAFQWEIIPVETGDDGLYVQLRSTLAAKAYYIEYFVDSRSGNESFRLNTKAEGADASRQRWKMEAVEETPNRLDATMRDAIMKGWKDYYCKPDPQRGGQILGTGGWWGDAEMLEIILDACETTGNEAHKTLFMQLYANFIARHNSSWTYNEFNDDIAWMVIVCARAYLLFGEEEFRTHAKNNFDAMYNRALLTTGMLRWKQTPANNTGTNSCINGPAEVAACYLAEATGDDSYYGKARNLYALQRQHLYNASNGQVYDSFTWQGNTPSNYNHWASTYNQGTFLGAALLLYRRYGDAQYREDALKIVNYTRNNLCNAQGIINVCGSGDDLSGFKGILMRYLRRFIVDLAQPEWVDWMQTNAVRAFNNRNSQGVIWTAWWAKTAENFVFKDGSNEFNFANKPFGASTAVSLAFNTPLDKNRIIKDAFSTIEAEHFDYLKGVLTETQPDAVYLKNIKNGYWTAYNNTDFGNKPVERAEFQIINSSTMPGRIEIRAGSLTGDSLGSVAIPVASSANEQITVSCDVRPATGLQNIYLRYLGRNGLSFKLDSFRFLTAAQGVTSVAPGNAGIYPNPAETFVRITSPQSGNVSIYTADGKRIYTANIPQGTTTLDVRPLEKGIYLIQNRIGDTILNQQFIKK